MNAHKECLMVIETRSKIDDALEHMRHSREQARNILTLSVMTYYEMAAIQYAEDVRKLRNSIMEHQGCCGCKCS